METGRPGLDEHTIVLATTRAEAVRAEEDRRVIAARQLREAGPGPATHGTRVQLKAGEKCVWHHLGGRWGETHFTVISHTSVQATFCIERCLFLHYRLVCHDGDSKPPHERSILKLRW